MNFSIIIFFLYLVLLGWMLFSARRSTETKRAMIKVLFNIEDNQIRSTGYDDPRIQKFTLAGWSLAFVMAGVLLGPAVALGDNIWVQVLVLSTLELGFLMVGLVVMRTARIMNWYLECYLCNFQFYKKGFALTIFAIIFGNTAYAVPMVPLGLAVQMAAVIIMTVAMYLMISPIQNEMKYYTNVETVEETTGAEAVGT